MELELVTKTDTVKIRIVKLLASKKKKPNINSIIACGRSERKRIYVQHHVEVFIKDNEPSYITSLMTIKRLASANLGEYGLLSVYP